MVSAETGNGAEGGGSLFPSYLQALCSAAERCPQYSGGINSAFSQMHNKKTQNLPLRKLLARNWKPVRNPKIFHKYVTTHLDLQNSSTKCTERLVSGSLTAAGSSSARQGQPAAAAIGNTQLQSPKGTFFVGAGSNEQKCL